MHNDRIFGRPSLGHKDLVDGRGIERVGAEAVHRLRRKRDEPAGAQYLDRLCDHGGVGILRVNLKQWSGHTTSISTKDPKCRKWAPREGGSAARVGGSCACRNL